MVLSIKVGKQNVTVNLSYCFQRQLKVTSFAAPLSDSAYIKSQLFILDFYYEAFTALYAGFYTSHGEFCKAIDNSF